MRDMTRYIPITYRVFIELQLYFFNFFYLDGLNELRGKPGNLHEDHFKPLEPGKVAFLISSRISCSPSLTFDIACVDLKIKGSYLFSPSLECKCSMTFGTLIDLKESRI